MTAKLGKLKTEDVKAVGNTTGHFDSSHRLSLVANGKSKWHLLWLLALISNSGTCNHNTNVFSNANSAIL